MAYKPEKLCRPARSRNVARSRSAEKQQLHRAERREAKRLLDEAPKRRAYCGWDD
jgi:hypothetical protein